MAPIYPWIYTGGIDPFLWFPIPGVQTMNFVPYRVNLSPIAGMLDVGQPHTIALSVFNADSYFFGNSVAAALSRSWVGAGHGRGNGKHAYHAITGDHGNTHTLKNRNIQGTVKTASGHSFKVSEYLKTSQGMMATTVTQNIEFTNVQKFKITALSYEQIDQGTTIHSTVSHRDVSGLLVDKANYTWPMTMDIGLVFNRDGSGTQTTAVNQYYERDEEGRQNGQAVSFSVVKNRVTPTDTLEFNASFQIIGNENQSSAQTYFGSDSTGYCYSRSIAAANNVLTSISGVGCN